MFFYYFQLKINITKHYIILAVILSGDNKSLRSHVFLIGIQSDHSRWVALDFQVTGELGVPLSLLQMIEKPEKDSKGQ